MSLDVMLYAMRKTEVYTANITHNLNQMAKEAGIYEALWRPEEIPIKTAGELIPLLREGLTKLKGDSGKFMALNPSNGWGNYLGLVSFVEKYLAACMENPDAEVEANR